MGRRRGGPLALGSISGIAQPLGTSWGLLRHWWVVAKLVLSLVATAVLLLHLQVADRAAADALLPLGDAGAPVRTQLLIDAAGGLGVLLLITALSVYKPAGLTGFRRRPATAR